MAASISLSSATSTVFPPPPPTTNTLTLEQRAQLRKSAKKLKQVLGATPQLLDTDIVGILGPVHVQLPRSKTSSSWSQSSCDSFSSRSSSSLSFYPSHPYATCTSLDRKPSTASSVSRQGSFRTKSSSTTSQAPILQLAVAPPSPTSSSSSSSFLSKASLKLDLIASHSRSKSANELVSTTDTSSDMRFILHPTRHSSAVESSDPICESAVKAPSSSAARRQKMNRLRKMLGADVPVHLVFPDGKEDDEVVEAGEGGGREGVSTDERPFPISPVPVAGTVTPRPRKSGAGKIMGTRDSMGIVSPHRAKRQEKQKPEKNSPPLHTLPFVVTPAPTLHKDSSEKPLCVIVESPDEHGSSPFEGFGFGGSTIKSTLVVESKWHVTSSTTGSGIGFDDASKLWNTRRGYSGWDRPTAMGKSESARKKSMSYRKPPPPIDF